jgi:hypothetical protein
VGERDWDKFCVCKPRPCVVKTSLCSQLRSTDLRGGSAPLCILCLLLLIKAHINKIILSDINTENFVFIFHLSTFNSTHASLNLPLFHRVV